MYRSNALKQRVSSLAYTSLAASTDVIVDWYVSRCLPDCMLTSSLTRNDISRSLGRETMSTSTGSHFRSRLWLRHFSFD